MKRDSLPVGVWHPRTPHSGRAGADPNVRLAAGRYREESSSGLVAEEDDPWEPLQGLARGISAG